MKCVHSCQALLVVLDALVVHLNSCLYCFTHIFQGTNQNSAGFEILPVEIKTGIFPKRDQVAICAGRILNHASTGHNFDFYWDKSQFG